MPGPAAETVEYPFTAFNFLVDIRVGSASVPICSAAFSECDGLEVTMDVKTLREGGDNNRQIRLAGPVSYGQVTLRRGMTTNYDLWDWFDGVARDPSRRATGQVAILAPDGATPRATFLLERCLPLKVKAPALNAREGGVAIEELQVAYELLTLERQQNVDILTVAASLAAGGAGA